MTNTKTASTARDLLDLIREFGPAIDGGDLTFIADPPPELDALLRVLHTGVRALLTKRRWWGSTSEKARVIELSPAARIPSGISLLVVEGDARWDRIDPAARIDFPKLFATTEDKDC